MAFQSTPSGRKATQLEGCICTPPIGFNPRLPGGRRRGNDRRQAYQPAFQSTPSGRKATRRLAATPIPLLVSIHAFREEGDFADYGIDMRRILFQSTPSGRKATGAVLDSPSAINGFNPRLPGGRRRCGSRTGLRVRCFNPRLPGGRRPEIDPALIQHGDVSIHAFREEGDVCLAGQQAADACFNPRLPGGRRQA